jgi:S1-C subfamily serine protease
MTNRRKRLLESGYTNAANPSGFANRVGGQMLKFCDRRGLLAYFRTAITPMLAVGAACCGVAILQPGIARAQQSAAPAAAASSTAPPPAQSSMSDLQGVNEYLNSSGEAVEISQLGITARNGQATVDDGQNISGVAVIDVSSGGPSAEALGSHDASHYVLGGVLLGAGVASAVFFPPALIGVVMLANSHAVSSYDLVVGVDGNRVRNTMEFMQSVADVRSGDTVYLAVVRHGRRVQVPIHLP